MKKGAKIGCFFIVVLLLAAGVAGFFRGWVQFAVGIDEVGVLVSKTGGVKETPIEKGHFQWRWELLLPTNARLLKFPTAAIDYHKTIHGALPSADIYSLQIQQMPDFSYDFDFDLALQLEPDELVALVKAGTVASEEDIASYLDKSADRIASLTAQFLIAESEKTQGALLTALSTEQLVAGIHTVAGEAGAELTDIAICSIFVRSARVPDMELYNRAKATYDGFQSLVDDELSKLARKQAEAIVSDNRAVNKLTKIGEVLKNYPELSDVLKSSDTAAVLKVLDSLQ